MRTLYLREFSDSFTAHEELEEHRFRVEELGLHLTVFGTMTALQHGQQSSAGNSWYLRIAKLGPESSFFLYPDGRSAYATWETLMLDYDPHDHFPLQLEVHGEPEFHDGDWLNNLWTWLADPRR